MVKPKRDDTKVLLASGAALLIPLMVIIGAKQKEAALNAAVGRYQYVKKAPKQTDTVYTYDLKPDGTFLLRTDVNEPFPPKMRNNPKSIAIGFGQEGLDYLINSDGTVSTLERGTFSAGGNEVELKMPEPILKHPTQLPVANRALVEMVYTFRVSEKGLIAIRSEQNSIDAYTRSIYRETKDVPPDRQHLSVRIR